MFYTDLIKKLAEQYPLNVIVQEKHIEIKDVSLLDGTQQVLTPTTLYFGYDQGGELPDQCILVDVIPFEPTRLPGKNLATLSAENLFAAFNFSQKSITESMHTDLYYNLTQIVRKSHSLQTLLDAAATEMGNPLIVTDLDYKILGYSTIFPVHDPLWAKYIGQGYCNYSLVRAVEKSDLLRSKFNTSDTFGGNVCASSPVRKLHSKIIHNGFYSGCVTMLEENSGIMSYHYDRLPIITEVVGQTILHFTPSLLTNETYDERMLYGLLIGASPKDFDLESSSLHAFTTFCALSIQSTKHLDSADLRQRVYLPLKSILPKAYSAFHKGNLVLLIPLENSFDLEDRQMQGLKSLADAESLQIGVSNYFHNLSELSEYYRQACAAIDLEKSGSARPFAVKYASLCFNDLLRTIQLQLPDIFSLKRFLHPALAILRENDRQTGSELHLTLRTFLESSCSIKDTAASLFVHRNTVVYRLTRISDICHIDLGDSHLRFLLHTSYQLEKYLGDCQS